jgi:hypothetical protein
MGNKAKSDIYLSMLFLKWKANRSKYLKKLQWSWPSFIILNPKSKYVKHTEIKFITFRGERGGNGIIIGREETEYFQ